MINAKTGRPVWRGINTYWQNIALVRDGSIYTDNPATQVDKFDMRTGQFSRWTPDWNLNIEMQGLSKVSITLWQILVAEGAMEWPTIGI